MEAVVVALITGGFAVVVAIIDKFRKENRADHNSVMDRLDLVSSEIRKDIRQVRGELSDHVNGGSHAPAKMPAKKRPKAG